MKFIKQLLCDDCPYLCLLVHFYNRVKSAEKFMWEWRRDGKSREMYKSDFHEQSALYRIGILVNQNTRTICAMQYHGIYRVSLRKAEKTIGFEAFGIVKRFNRLAKDTSIYHNIHIIGDNVPDKFMKEIIVLNVVLTE